MPEPQVVAGFPEMWQPVHDKYSGFFDCAAKLQPLVNEMTFLPMTGQLQQFACRMVLAAATATGAMLTLVLNGYGQDAMKLARSIYEIDLNLLWLKNHPDHIKHLVNYAVLQMKNDFDALDEEEQKEMPKEQHDKTHGRLYRCVAGLPEQAR